MTTTPAPTEAEKFLEELRQETLRKEWTPERSSVVDIIDSFYSDGVVQSATK